MSNLGGGARDITPTLTILLFSPCLASLLLPLLLFGSFSLAICNQGDDRGAQGLITYTFHRKRASSQASLKSTKRQRASLEVS